MKLNNKGFSLIELLGVIVLIGVISGIVGISYANLDKQINKTYYKNLENSLLLAGNEYFAFNKCNLSQEVRINIKTLIEKKYISEVVDENKEFCDLENSYVSAYKKSYDKVDYFVCLICNDYISSDDRCFK